ncbi:Acyl-homoserine lactone acylase QuiP [Polaribacter huanghezhanensis]|uniref:penicillin acylase family protein n=1 Tax=Polaribacter huanghezhanensis TaxID=1354726 RepID=UPI002649800A|nr:penicillin acylase family protein [Polaribacter huanghezhanensis]WKD85825.1 Acyl-homoserine lactone acylase QuiP [Polaribacter huanghezhanensis]
MKIFKKFLKVVAVFIVLIFVGFWLFSRTLYPTYNGELELANISDEVTVYYDEVGVPHINAQNQKDAYTALGYVHAQDRLWQMELIRRIAAGRLAEIFGKELIKTDKFFSGLGIEEASAKTIKNLDKNSEAYKLTMAYLDGINQFMENGPTPIEFYLVGVDKEKYTIKDVYNVFGYMAFSFAAAYKTDPMLTEVKEKLGAAYFNEISLSNVKNTVLIHNEKNPILTASVAAAMQELNKNLPLSPFIGSNSWVLGPEKTKYGRVIFANDPHIGYSQPSVWYQSHIKTPDYEMYGFNLALSPFSLIGHNREYAYGMTMFENDDVDFYFEKNNPDNPNEYLTDNGCKTYDVIEKRIKVKDQKDAVYQIKVSQHGPIVNDLMEQIDDKRPIAMQWIYTKLNNELLEVGYDISHSNSLAEFKKGAARLHAPGLNMMYGDAKNNIAWFASGKLYKYREGINTKTVLDGASGKDEILEYYDFEENPQAINPSWNYVYSANNEPDSIKGGLYPGYYLPEDRAKRIVSLLKDKNDFTKEDVAKMLYDVTSATVASNITTLATGIDKENLSPSEKLSLDYLKKWNGFYGKKEIAPTIYNRFIYEVLVATYQDEMGKSFKQFINTPYQDKAFVEQIAREESVWWDNIKTVNKKETRTDIITSSYKKAIAFLGNQLGENVQDWTWDRVISVEYPHALGKVAALRSYFNVGPFKTRGGNEVINNQIFNLDSTGVYKITAGPSTRRIVDFSDVENSLGILPTGQSGNVFSDHYKDQAQKYVDGEFVKMKLNQKEIEASENVLIFKVKK